MPDGKTLIRQLKEHVLSTMAGMPECARNSGAGAGWRLIEEIAGLELRLERQDGWLTWSLIVSLVNDGLVEVVPGTESRRKFRLR